MTHGPLVDIECVLHQESSIGGDPSLGAFLVTRKDAPSRFSAVWVSKSACHRIERKGARLLVLTVSGLLAEEKGLA